MSSVMSAQAWPSNADLMVDVHKLVRDVTYGRGLWWAKHRPDKLSASANHSASSTSTASCC